MDIATALLDYLASIKHLAPKSRIGYQQRLTVFAEWCAGQGLTLERVNNRHVQTFLASLRETRTPHKVGQAHLSTHTIAGYLRCIRAFLHWTLEDDEYSQYTTYQHVKGIKMPRCEQTIKEVFTDQELEALFAAASKNHLYAHRLRDTAILSLLLDCGLRAAELCTLTVGHVTLARIAGDDSYVTVMGKESKQREIPLGDKARRALARYMRECRKDAKKSDPVFLSRYHTPLTTQALRLTLQRLAAVALPPVDQCNPHKFRHTFATRFMASGGDVYDLSRLLGHSSVSITENYLRSLSAKAVRTRRRQESVLDHL